MLKPLPLANAVACASVVFYAFLYLLKLIAPPFFKLLLDSQFLGAPIASQVPDLNFANFLGALIAVACISWIFGYLVAVFYNRFSG
ncbi:hypothetical protein A2693_02555 [Candidatus Curtissbacteria bacterium RIFCSPHIGHO2_01_FULL_40_12]|uniref:DUF2062 domain-containing protein n=1 Tax=Candidatus Curtissbacteria bacterium RIFCSPHIGHO2_01_FULL_40_12 TaxID=1797710 RepID=A0A1F5G8D6_9BACT|nr:MAG: hypothetical protein A2693_02555 [Candidatus Curtissbacteria bacterium RIFCSPHIGHO2_01_FULL_40_12]